MNKRIFLKIGGSYITDKTRSESLLENRIRLIARAVSEAISESSLELVLAHGAGSYGHIKAKQYQAQKGVHPQFGWKGFYEIRQDMMRMNLRLIQICAEENFFPITVQPSAIISAKNGKIVSMFNDIIKSLLKSAQIPILHGDIIFDENQGFTIASTEDILAFLSKSISFDRVLMISDVPGVLNAQKEVIPHIHSKNYNEIIRYLKGGKGADVTGGMRNKVEQLFSLIRIGNIQQAVITSAKSDLTELKRVIIGEVTSGTLITS